MSFRVTASPLPFSCCVLVLGLVYSFLTGCGASLTVKTGELKPVHRVAVLPIVAKTQLNRENLDLLNSLVVAESRSRGLEVLDPTRIDYLRSQTSNQEIDCSTLRDLIERYELDGLVQFSISSVISTDLLLGYLSRLKGELKLYSADCGEQVTISDSVGDSGGLLFFTGQLVEGIRSTFSRHRENENQRLIERLVSRLFSAVPSEAIGHFQNPEAIIQRKSEENDLKEQTKTTIVPVNSRRNLIDLCVELPYTEDSAVFVRVKGVRSRLRPIRAKRYCGRFSDQIFSDSRPVLVEWRTPFGELNRKSVDVNQESDCDLVGSFRRSKQRVVLRIELKMKETLSCRSGRYLIYRQAVEDATDLPVKLREVKRLPSTVSVIEKQPYNYFAVEAKAGKLASDLIPLSEE